MESNAAIEFYRQIIRTKLFISIHPAAGRHWEQGTHVPEGSDKSIDGLLRWATRSRPGGISGYYGDWYGLHIIKIEGERKDRGVIVMSGKASERKSSIIMNPQMQIGCKST